MTAPINTSIINRMKINVLLDKKITVLNDGAKIPGEDVKKGF